MTSAGRAGPERRSALVVDVPEAEPLVSRFRAEHDVDAVLRRIPPHVTVLFPFVPVAELGRAIHSRVAAVAGRVRAFDAQLARAATFEGHVWLAPVPRARFVRLMRRVYAAFPLLPPYGGLHPDPEPHLTVGRAASAPALAAVAAAAERELVPALPLSFRVDALALLAEEVDGTWSSADSFPLAGS